ncbi:MAG: tRNA (guanosine(37)-N1)-methyltransferase TrmD [Planctomycetota bacterium]
MIHCLAFPRLLAPFRGAVFMLCAILTLFPMAVRPYLAESILGIAHEKGKLRTELINFRDFTTDPHRTVDDRPFGGGPGMVLKPEPIFDAVEYAEREHGPFHKILLCPRGVTFTQKKARALAQHERLLLLCGRYEGFDERIRDGMGWDEISIGDYVLAGGELPALVVLEAVARLLPGVLGCEDSPILESFETDLLDYPQYTRPRSFRGMDVPEILISGNHRAVAAWRREQAERLTEIKRHRT